MVDYLNVECTSEHNQDFLSFSSMYPVDRMYDFKGRKTIY